VFVSNSALTLLMADSRWKQRS